MSIKTRVEFSAEFEVDVVVIGAGGGGLTAALSAADNKLDVLVLERNNTPIGNTSLSAGLIPAAGTKLQKEKGIIDSAEIFAKDLAAKAKYQNNPAVVKALTEASGTTIDWLVADKGLALQCIDAFTYPGHSVCRMHGPLSQSGADLHSMLLKAVEEAGVDVLTNALVDDLFINEKQRIVGVGFKRPDGSYEQVGCKALILACNGFGGNKDLVKKYIPEMQDAEYCGFELNTGHALLWGQELGAKLADLTGYQGHASVSASHKALLTWAVIAQGGIQVNQNAERFSNEMNGYSEQASQVLLQPSQKVWNIYDARCEEAALAFQEYKDLKEMGAIKFANTIEELSQVTGLNLERLKQTLNEVNQYASGDQDPFGRTFNAPSISAPYRAALVTAGLFHTQGGVEINEKAQVLQENGNSFPNLFAIGGAARGVSGPEASGYLSGNGLLSAVVLGYIAGQSVKNAIYYLGEGNHDK